MKKTFPVKPLSPALTRPLRGQSHPSHLPVMQPKAVAAPQKPQPPLAPPAYRPHPVPKVLQTKKAMTAPQPVNQLRSTPAAPPIYRPQPIPKVLQTKRAASQQPQAVESSRRPVAPPVYRPQPVPKVLQTKQANVKVPAPILRPGNPRGVLQRKSSAPNPTAALAPRVHAGAKNSSGVIQAAYDNQNWNIQNLIDNAGATALGKKMIQALEALDEEVDIGVAEGGGFTDPVNRGITIERRQNEGDATQQFIQELSNYLHKKQLMALKDEAIRGVASKGVYVVGVHKIEHQGALAAMQIFAEAQKASAEWTKGGSCVYHDAFAEFEQFFMAQTPAHVERVESQFDTIRQEQYHAVPYKYS